MKRNTLAAIVTVTALLLTSVSGASAHTLTSSPAQTNQSQRSFKPTAWHLANCPGKKCTFSNKNTDLVMVLQGQVVASSDLLVYISLSATAHGHPVASVNSWYGAASLPAGRHTVYISFAVPWQNVPASWAGPAVITAKLQVMDNPSYNLKVVSHFTLTP